MVNSRQETAKLLNFNVSRTRSYFYGNPAAANFAAQLLASNGTLHGNWLGDGNRPRAGVHIQIEGGVMKTAVRKNGHGLRPVP